MGLCIVGPDRVPRPCQGGVQAQTDFFIKKSLLPFFEKTFLFRNLDILVHCVRIA